MLLVELLGPQIPLFQTSAEMHSVCVCVQHLVLCVCLWVTAVLCAANAVTQAQPVRQRMNTLFIDCFKCINNPPTSWKKVVMELDSSAGDLYVTLNDRRRQHVFQGLPTHVRLYPCLMAVNTGQAHFELLEATLH